MFFSLLKEWAITPISQYRLFHNFVRQDFAAQVVGSLGGVLWLFITPIVNILIYAYVFTIVFRAPMPVEYDGTPFIVFLMMGYLPWFAFADAVGRSGTLLLEKAPLITKVMFPVQIIPAVGTLVPYLVHGIGFGLFLSYLAFTGHFSLMWLMLPVVFVLQFLFTLGLVAVLSALCVFLRDIQQMVALVITTWFFMTPIIYPITLIPERLRPLLLFNPMHSFVQLYREIVLLDTFTMLHLQIVTVSAILSYCLGGWLFMRIRHAFGDVL